MQKNMLIFLHLVICQTNSKLDTKSHFYGLNVTALLTLKISIYHNWVWAKFIYGETGDKVDTYKQMCFDQNQIDTFTQNILDPIHGALSNKVLCNWKPVINQILCHANQPSKASVPLMPREGWSLTWHVSAGLCIQNKTWCPLSLSCCTMFYWQ